MGVIKDILRTMDYGPSPEGSEHVRAWLEEHKAGFGHFINGAFTKPGDLFDVFNPANGERIARVSQGSAKDIDAAMAVVKTMEFTPATLEGHKIEQLVQYPIDFKLNAVLPVKPFEIPTRRGRR